MTKPNANRRRFLQLASGAAAGTAFPDAIARALALPAAAARTGTLRDLEHVVIFMQENRSFDHYFGTLRGVRGFADPRPMMLPGGSDVFHQPQAPGSAEVVTPFRLDAATTSAQSLKSLDHSWKGSHERWKWHDAWVPAKTPLTMGYFTREDLPFHHALADAFTVCDAYHCSIFAATNPNRMFLFTGTSGLAAGDGRAPGGRPIRTTSSTRPPTRRTTRRAFGRTGGPPTPSGWKRRASPGGSIRSMTITVTTPWRISRISADLIRPRRSTARAARGSRGRTPPTPGPPSASIWWRRSRATWPPTACRRCPGSWRPMRSASTRRPRPAPARR